MSTSRPWSPLALALVLLGLAVAPSPAAAALPVLRLQHERAIRDEPKVAATLAMPGYAGRVGIEVRGNTSQRFPKKSFGFETRTAAGKDREVALLGMPADDDWVLYAPYNDKSLLRNVLAYEAAARLGRYAPRTRLVELRRNGRYEGVYVLTERPKLGADRVAFDQGRGGFLAELTTDAQLPRPGTFFRTRVTRRPVVFEDPDRGDASPFRRERIARQVRGFEDALYAGRGWRRHLDEASAVDHVLINELFKNQDGFFSSTFVAGRPGRKLVLGPVWDFDISMGNANYGRAQYRTGWGLSDKPWAERLYRDRAFVRAYRARWRALRADGYVARLQAFVDTTRRSLDGAQQRNFRRWPVLGRYVWPNPMRPGGGYRASHAEEVRFLKAWLDLRVRWIDANIGRLGR